MGGNGNALSVVEREEFIRLITYYNNVVCNLNTRYSVNDDSVRVEIEIIFPQLVTLGSHTSFCGSDGEYKISREGP